MLQFLFDTDHLTLLERGHAPVVRRFVSQPVDSVALSPITVEEALRGRLAHLSRKHDVGAYALLVGTVELLNQLPIAPYYNRCEQRYQQLRAGLRVGSQDLRIAAVALVNTLILVTRNQQDFAKVSEIQTDDWSR